ncbi:MAG: alcohol dehydrogenase catalytic domain-containing protein [Deltaproteobacteria bacterium]|nr:alcohol dehydrogenase catalytic domain-containing protein [Deltaproteobacteria bacterium]
MKAIVKYDEKAGCVGIREMPEPEPGPFDVKVQIKATGLCYSDMSIIQNKYVGRKPVPIPLILGHEGAGVVVKTGEAVRNVAVGDRVGMVPIEGCMVCSDCLSGNENMCMNWRHLGITYHGTFAEYTVTPAAKAHKIPDEVSFVDAACLEPIGLSARTFELVKFQLGDTVAIVGPGSLGIFHLQAFKAAGAAKVIMIGLDQDKERFEVAKIIGADIVNGSKEDVVSRVFELTDGKGVDVAVETANSPAATRLAIDVTGNKGRVALFGLYPEANISPLVITRRGLTVIGDVAQVQRHYLRAMRWVAQGYVRAEPFISRTYHLDEFEEAFAPDNLGKTFKVIFEI